MQARFDQKCRKVNQVSKFSILMSLWGPFKKGKNGLKMKIAILVIETYFLASRLIVTRKTEQNIIFENVRF